MASKLRTINAIGAGGIGAGAVGPAELASLAVETSKLANDAVTTAKIGAGTIIETDVAVDAITTIKILNLAVTTGKIDALAVTAGKLAIDAVETLKIKDLNVTTGKINDLAVATGKLGANAVTSDKIDTLVIQSVQVALTSANILAMNGAPVTILAGVAGKVIVIDDICLQMTTTAVVYANGGAVEFRYTGAAGAKVTADTAPVVITAAAGTSYTINKSIVTSLTGVVSDPIVITNAAAPFITGTGTGILTIRYHLI